MTVVTPKAPEPPPSVDAGDDAPDRDEPTTSEAVSLLIILGVAALFALLLMWVVIVFHRYEPPEEPVQPDRPPRASVEGPADAGPDGLIMPTREP